MSRRRYRPGGWEDCTVTRSGPTPPPRRPLRSGCRTSVVTCRKGTICIGAEWRDETVSGPRRPDRPSEVAGFTDAYPRAARGKRDRGAGPCSASAPEGGAWRARSYPQRRRRAGRTIGTRLLARSRTGGHFAATTAPARPDGSCIGAESCLWNAEYAGGRLVRYAPTGEAVASINLPVSHPTCCCFGGPGLDRLHVTSAAEPLTREQVVDEPMAGRVLALDVGMCGRPEHRVAF